jgi:preprotein translocase subunit SecB
MSEKISDGAGAPAAPLKVLVQYLKDLSFENPGAPHIHMIRGEAPRAQLHLDVRARTVSPMQYEVSLVLHITAQREQETVYIVELEYAGLFDLSGVPEERITPALMIEAPRILFPFAREILAKATREGGYPPVLLNPIDFVAVFRDRLRQQTEESAEAPAPSA